MASPAGKVKSEEEKNGWDIPQKRTLKPASFLLLLCVYFPSQFFKISSADRTISRAKSEIYFLL